MADVRGGLRSLRAGAGRLGRALAAWRPRLRSRPGLPALRGRQSRTGLPALRGRPSRTGLVNRLRIAEHWFTNRGVRVKVLLGTMVMAMVALLTGVLALVQMGQINNGLNDLEQVHLARLQHLSDVRGALAEANSAFAFYVDNSGPARTLYRERIATAENGLDAAWAAYVETADPSPTWRNGVARFQTAFTEYRDLRAVAVFKEKSAGDVSIQIPADPAGVSAMFDRTAGEYYGALGDLVAFEKAEVTAATDEADTTYLTARIVVIAGLLLGMVVAVAAALVVAGRIVRPLTEVRDVLKAVAEGDLTRSVDARSADEVGRMARSVNQATESIRETVRALANSARTLATSSERLVGAGSMIASNAESTTVKARVLAETVDDVSRNVQTVAAGSEETGAAMREISRSAGDAADVVERAVQTAASTNKIMEKLGESSVRIGNVVKVINSIAEQTNLLALNATIEAARAGAAGRGFAVVAGEVKDLAQETARATEDISRQVETIQSDATNAVTAIEQITSIIGRVNELQATIASAVEQQTATTHEINRSIAEAANGSIQIADDVAAVASAALATSDTISDSQRASRELADMSEHLRTVVDRFQI